MKVAAIDRQGRAHTPAVDPPAERSVVRSSDRPRGRSIPASRIAFCLPALASFLLLCFRNRYVFSVAIREEGDLAANSLLVQRAAHLHQLVGEYSRVGFNHPGPAFLYAEAIGQTIFYRLLHLVPSAFDGQLLATFALNAVVVGLVVWIMYRRTHSPLGAGVAFAVLLAYTGYHLTLASPWFPHLFFACFLLFMVAGASIASHDLTDLPTFVFAGAMLAHGHIAFLEFVGVWTLVVAVVWLHRNRPGLHAAATHQHRPIVIAGAILGLFLLPLILNVVLHFPGEWRKYASYLKHNGTRTHSMRAAADYLMGFWAHRRGSGALLIAAGVVAVVLSRREPDPQRRRFLGWLLGAALVMSVVFLSYAVSGVDDLTQGYIGIFYMAVPLLVLMVAGAATASALGPRLGSSHAGGGVLRDRVGVAVAVAMIVVLLLVGATGRFVSNPYRGRSDLAAAIATVKAAPQRSGRAVAIDFPHDSWPVVVGFLSNAQRAGLDTCLVDPFWTFMVTRDHLCQAGVVDRSWHLRFDPVTTAVSPERVAVWSDSDTAITASR